MRNYPGLLRSALIFAFLLMLPMKVGNAQEWANPCEEEIYPDLCPVKSRLYETYNFDTASNVYLRFTNGIANVGPWELLLEPGGPYNPADSTRPAKQRVGCVSLDEDTLTWQYSVGQFEYHLAHGHVHFGNLAQYSIRRYLPGGGVGDTLKTGSKIGFCMVDNVKYQDTCCGPVPAGVPPKKVFIGCVQTIPQFQSYFNEGISKGWLDEYRYWLAEQWIDISNILQSPGPGIYWLQSVVDPDKKLKQITRTNDTVRVPVFIVRKDSYEPNDSKSLVDAMPIAGSFSSNLSACQTIIDSLSIHRATFNVPIFGTVRGDTDYFKIYLADTATASHYAKITFSDLTSTAVKDGNLDMEIRNASDGPTGYQGLSSDDDELIPLNGLLPGTYYVRIYGRTRPEPEPANSHYRYKLELALPIPRCGDVNGDGQISIQDVIVLNNYLTPACNGSGSVPPCMGRADVNGNCIVNCEDRDILNAYVNGTGQLPGMGCSCQ